MQGFVITLAFLLTFIPESNAFDGPPPMDMNARRAPGMDGERPRFELSNIKFEYDSESKLFKDETEARDYQSLFEKNKESKEVKDYFSQLEIKKKEKMENLRKQDVRPDFEKMKLERREEQVAMLKELKLILDKKKAASDIAITTKDSVKCEAGKSPAVLDKANIDSLKDTSKVVKVVLTEEEFARMKQTIKDEVKKEMMNDMAKNKPKDVERSEPREKRERPSEDKKEGERKMAGGSMGGRPDRKAPMQNSGANTYGGIDMSIFQNSGMQNQNSGMQMQSMAMTMNQGQFGTQQAQQMSQGQRVGYNQMGANSGYNFGYGYQQQQQMQRRMPQMHLRNSQLNYGMNVNYNNSYTASYSNPYAFYQYTPYKQYPMMGMGN